MISFLFFLLSFKSFCFPPELNSVYERLETHEFYKDNELITKPLDAWQVIASFSLVNKDLSLSRACLKYRPAQEANGLFRVETMSIQESCSSEGKKIYEIDSLYGIQFERFPEFKIVFSHKNFTTSSWIIPSISKKKTLSLLDTPDKYWGESAIFLNEELGTGELIKDGERCLNVADDCTILGESKCHMCENISLEAPNGCLVGPRYCSSSECGTKGNPACRRGVKFQKKRVLDCRTDSSFAICAGDSTPTCRGQEVWCL